MKVELTIKEGSLETKVTIDGYYLMVEAILAAIKKAAHETSQYAEVR